MLLQHGWLAELSKPSTISEEDEDEEAAEAGADLGSSGTEDPEVAAWVKKAIERKKNGLMGESQKPALHAAPLDSISPISTPG
jgi:mitogen-activated protein kinase kinase